MIKIRHEVFETNSSSTHSISITPGMLGVLDTLELDSNAEVTIYGQDFGWEEESFSLPEVKAAYCFLDVQGNEQKTNMLIDLIKEHTGALKVTFEPNGGYIDHQSSGTSYEAFQDKETLRRFIFSPDSILTTDNDNH